MFCCLYLQYMYCEALNNNNLTKHSSNLQQHFKLQTALVSLYEHKIQKIQSCYGDDSISLSQKEQQIQISFRCMHVCFSFVDLSGYTNRFVSIRHRKFLLVFHSKVMHNSALVKISPLGDAFIY